MHQSSAADRGSRVFNTALLLKGVVEKKKKKKKNGISA